MSYNLNLCSKINLFKLRLFNLLPNFQQPINHKINHNSILSLFNKTPLKLKNKPLSNNPNLISRMKSFTVMLIKRSSSKN